MLAAVFRPFGPYPMLWVIPVMGSLSLLGLYLVVREWVGPGWALLAAAALMAVNLEPGQDEFVTIAEVKVPGRSGPPPEVGDDRPGPGWRSAPRVGRPAARRPRPSRAPGPLRAPRGRQVRPGPVDNPLKTISPWRRYPVTG